MGYLETQCSTYIGPAIEREQNRIQRREAQEEKSARLKCIALDALVGTAEGLGGWRSFWVVEA
jgi:hypothetical protein